MGIIKPTLTLTANANTATTDAGPMSIALNLSATDSLDVTEVQSKILDMSGTTHQIVWTAADFTSSGAFGEDGAFMYFKNLLTDNAPADTLHDIIIHTGDADADGAGHANRFFTLQPGEFAWMPWDCTQDIYADPQETNTGALECWLFVRTGTA